MSEQLSIIGGERLVGEVKLSGAKNTALPILFASLLCSEESCLENVPELEDIDVTLRLLRSLGAKASFSNGTIRICTENIGSTEASYSLVKAMRASFWVIGPLLVRVGRANVSLPGGDAIGTRPVDLHLKGLAQMGAEIHLKHGVVSAEAPFGLRAKEISLDYPSVGATHHLLMTMAGVTGKSVIKGAAKEPEIVELAQFLRSMGAEIEGEGSGTIVVQGRADLNGGKIKIAGDRIEAATYLIAGAVTNGRVSVFDLEPKVIESTLLLLEEAGCEINCEHRKITVTGPECLRSVLFETAPFPGVATDIQPLLMAAMCRAKGVSSITETVFDNRFGHVAEYRRFGADIKVDGSTALVKGVSDLSGAPVEARDIRSAAGLVVLGLMAEGVTSISDLLHLDRGYENLPEKLQYIGAKVSRIPVVRKREVVMGC